MSSPQASSPSTQAGGSGGHGHDPHSTQPVSNEFIAARQQQAIKDTAASTVTLAQANEALRAESPEMLRALADSMEHFSASNSKQAKDLLNRLAPLNHVLGGLHSNEPAVIADALKEAGTLVKLKLDPSAPKAVAEAQYHIGEALKTVQNEVRASGLMHAIKTELQSKAVVQTVEAAAQPNFVSHILDGAAHVFDNTIGKHQKWLNEQSTGKRLGFAVGYMALGSVLTDVGIRMASQGFSGVKEDTAQQIDKEGNRSVLILKKPLPAAERIVKAVLGSGSIAAGITGTGLGFYNLFAGM